METPILSEDQMSEESLKDLGLCKNYLDYNCYYNFDCYYLHADCNKIPFFHHNPRGLHRLYLSCTMRARKTQKFCLSQPNYAVRGLFALSDILLKASLNVHKRTSRYPKFKELYKIAVNCKVPLISETGKLLSENISEFREKYECQEYLGMSDDNTMTMFLKKFHLMDNICRKILSSMRDLIVKRNCSFPLRATFRQYHFQQNLLLTLQKKLPNDNDNLPMDNVEKIVVDHSHIMNEENHINFDSLMNTEEGKHEFTETDLFCCSTCGSVVFNGSVIDKIEKNLVCLKEGAEMFAGERNDRKEFPKVKRNRRLGRDEYMEKDINVTNNKVNICCKKCHVGIGFNLYFVSMRKFSKVTFINEHHGLNVLFIVSPNKKKKIEGTLQEGTEVGEIYPRFGVDVGPNGRKDWYGEEKIKRKYVKDFLLSLDDEKERERVWAKWMMYGSIRSLMRNGN